MGDVMKIYFSIFMLLVLFVFFNPYKLESRKSPIVNDQKIEYLSSATPLPDEILNVGGYAKDRYKYYFGGDMSWEDALEIGKAVYEVRRGYGLDLNLILAIIEVESGWNINAKSHMNAEGLMQVLFFYKSGKALWADILTEQGVINADDDVFDPYVNIKSGIYIINHYLERHGSLEKALHAYLGAPQSKYYLAVKTNMEVIDIGLENDIQEN